MQKKRKKEKNQRRQMSSEVTLYFRVKNLTSRTGGWLYVCMDLLKPITQALHFIFTIIEGIVNISLKSLQLHNITHTQYEVLYHIPAFPIIL